MPSFWRGRQLIMKIFWVAKTKIAIAVHYVFRKSIADLSEISDFSVDDKCDHPPRLSLFVGKLNFALQVKIGYNSLWIPMVLDKLWKLLTSLLDMLQSWLTCHFLSLDVTFSNILQPQNTPWPTKGLIHGGGPQMEEHYCLFFYIFYISHSSTQFSIMLKTSTLIIPILNV